MFLYANFGNSCKKLGIFIKKRKMPSLSIKELLQQLNMEVYQKHTDFHIWKLENHLGEIPEILEFQSRDFFEITFSRGSSTQIDVDQKNIVSNRDHLLFLSPGQKLKVDSTQVTKNRDTFIVFFTIHFLNTTPSVYHMIKHFPFFNMNVSSVFYTQGNVSDLYFNYFQKIYKEFHDSSAVSIKIIESLLTLILLETNKKLEGDLHFIPQQLSRKEEITYQFENLIKQTEQKYQKISFYADKLHVSSTYLSECVKDTTKKTAKEILTSYVLLEARSLLKRTSKTIESIAFELGFNESSNFINFYKKNTSITPNQERKK